VTVNLDEALRHFRSITHPNSFLLWADALCINQNDIEERENQVQLMGEVYRRAGTVRVWLGAGGLLEKKGLDAIERWSQCPCNGRLDMRYEGSRDNLSFGSEEDYRDIHLIALICQRPYWMRLWIVQELAFNKSVVLHCGPAESDAQDEELTYSLAGRCALWRQPDGAANFSPCAAIQEVVDNEFGGNWSADGLFQPILIK
jgi:hypothetical protein